MNKVNAVNRAAAAGLVALLPHPQHRAYLRVCREVCGCIFERHVQGHRLEDAGRRCPICGNTDPSPPVPPPILLDTPKERKPAANTKADLAYQLRDLRESHDALENTVNILIEGFKALIEVNNLKMPE